MRDEKLQEIHDAIWRKIYQRQQHSSEHQVERVFNEKNTYLAIFSLLEKLEFEQTIATKKNDPRKLYSSKGG